jgi:hypothetical protein
MTTSGHSPSITDEEYQQRLFDARMARHSTMLEGGRTPPEARAIQDQYVRGEIDGDEMHRLTMALVRRLLTKVGLPTLVNPFPNVGVDA